MPRVSSSRRLTFCLFVFLGFFGCMLVQVNSLSEKYHPPPQIFNDNCDAWAKEGKCATDEDAHMMWNACASACLKHAKDDNEQCQNWSLEGECSNNPNYIQKHCPESCGYAISWSPFVRREMGFDPLPSHPELAALESHCPQPGSLLTAADVMAGRLMAVLKHGGAASLRSLSHDAPTEFNYYYGLAEAVVYTMRLYDSVITGTGSQDMDLAHHKSESDEHLQRMEAIFSVINSGYDADLLMRSLPHWMHWIQASADAAHHANKHYYSPSHMREYDIQPMAEPVTILEEVCYPTFDDRIVSALNSHFLPPPPHMKAGNPFHRDPKYKFNVTERAYKTNVEPNAALLNGVSMPLMGLGTWQLEGDECVNAVKEALAIGYRHIDTAQAYRNEAEVGKAVRESGVPRHEIFIATKLSDERDGGAQGFAKLFEQQLKDLQTDYIDLYMLHSPFQDEKLQEETWKAMEAQYDAGKIRALGVSNFETKPLMRLLEYARVKPMVLQNKVDVYHFGKQLDNEGDRIIDFAQSEGIVVVGYSPLSAYPFAMKPSADPIVEHVAGRQELSHLFANRYGPNGELLPEPPQGKKATPSQVLLRWALQLGMGVIPRSSNPERLRENFNALYMPPLQKFDMDMLNLLQHLVSTQLSVAV